MVLSEELAKLPDQRKEVHFKSVNQRYGFGRTEKEIEAHLELAWNMIFQNQKNSL